MKKVILFVILSFVFWPIVNAENSTEYCKEDAERIAPGGVLTLNAVKPINENYVDVLWALGIKSNVEDYTVGLHNCDESLSVCNLYFKKMVGYDESSRKTIYNYEDYSVTVNWNPLNYNPKVKTAVEAFVSNMELQVSANGHNTASYILDDVNLLKYWVYNFDLVNDIDFQGFKYLRDEAFNFIPEYKNDSSNYNVDIIFSEAGSSYGDIFVSGQESSFYSLWYKGTLYLASTNEVGNSKTAQSLSVKTNEVIYVPGKPGNIGDSTSEELIAAAKERLAKELPGYEFNIEYKKEFCNLFTNDNEEPECPNIADFGYYNFLKDYDLKDLKYFNVTYAGVSKEYLILTDSSKMKTNNNKVSQDFDTDIKVETTASDVPDDMKIKVDEVEDNTNEYNEIKEKIVSEFEAYDISLLSGSLKDNITNTDGSFKVSIPIPDKLKGKKLTVYYINDNGEVEEYKLNTTNNVGSFETNHFSTYILAEVLDDNNSTTSSSNTSSSSDNETDEENSEPVDSENAPNTLDNSIIYFIMCTISLIGVVANSMYLSKIKS